MAFTQLPGTNFHDLNLDWLLKEMKNCLAEWASTKEEWEVLKGSNEAFTSFMTSQWDDFRTYVENYLANLPLTEEVSAKINAMAEDGTLLEIITHDEGEGSALSDVAAQWLAAHITQETGYVIDDTLTVQGAAADAKATGDEISDLKSAVEQVIVYTGTKTPVTPILTTTNEYLKADGTTDSSSSWKTTDFVDISESVDGKVTIRATLYGAYLGVAFYNASEEFISGISGANASDYGLSGNANPQLFTVDIPANTKYVRISGYKPNITEQTDLYILYYVSGAEDYVAGDFLEGELDKKIDVSQGVSNAGKVLTVGNDGNVALTSSPWASDLATKADKSEVNELKTVIGDPVYKNLVDTSKFVENSYIKGADGTIATSTYYDATDYILLKASTLYFVGNLYIGSSTLYHAFYSSPDESDFLSNPDIELTRDDNYHCTILVGASDVYARFSAPHNKSNFYISSYVDYYVAHTPMTFEEIASPMCRFKKILVIGDSISTDTYGSYKKWVSDLVDEGYFPEDVNNNSQHATGFVARYDGQANDFISRITAVQNKSDYDLVIVFGGVNDANQLIPMGETTDTDYTTYFGAAVRYFYKYMCTNFVNARIATILPLPCSTQNRDASVRGVQYTYSDYQKNVAEIYSLPILDLTNHGGFYPDAYREGIDYDTAQAFRMKWTLKVGNYDPDGIHPTEEYEKKFLAPMIKKFIESL